MHTTVIRKREAGRDVADGDLRVHHNGDWSGSAEIQWCEGEDVRCATVPGWVAAIFVLPDSPMDAVLGVMVAKMCVPADKLGLTKEFDKRPPVLPPAPTPAEPKRGGFYAFSTTQDTPPASPCYWDSIGTGKIMPMGDGVGWEGRFQFDLRGTAWRHIALISAGAPADAFGPDTAKWRNTALAAHTRIGELEATLAFRDARVAELETKLADTRLRAIANSKVAGVMPPAEPKGEPWRPTVDDVDLLPDA
jgi:hypothetical protein